MMAFIFKPWCQYWKILTGIRGLALLTAVSMAVSGFLEVISLLALVPVLNSVVSGANDQGDLLNKVMMQLGMSGGLDVSKGLILFVVCGLLSTTLRFVSEGLSLRVRNAVEVRCRMDMAKALLAVEWKSFVSMRQGEISKSLLIEGNQIAYGVRLFVAGIGTLLAALIFLLIAWVMSPEMTMYTIIFGGFGAGAYLLASGPVRRHVESLSSILTTIGMRVNDVFGNLKFFRASGRSAVARDESEKIFREFAKANYYSQIYPPGLRAMFEAAALVFIGAFLYWRMFVAGDSPASVLIFLAVFYRLAPKIMVVQDNFFQARTYLPWYETWKQRYDFALTHQQHENGHLEPSFKKGLSFDQVSFSYDKEHPILDQISLSLLPGECVAIVGPSGGGKSTLLDLTTALLRPESGQLLLDGLPLSEYDREAWCERIGFVPQECPLFHASVLQNIAWGDPHPDLSRAIECARSAHAIDFIEGLPEGMHTQIGERGARLSGGQRQRLGIARALYRQPWLLILDEATSALDGDAEEIVQHALEEMKGKVAMLMVAHRLKTVRMADRILVVEGGRIVESGGWDELIAKSGLFRAMLARQGMDVGS